MINAVGRFDMSVEAIAERMIGDVGLMLAFGENLILTKTVDMAFLNLSYN